MKPNKNLITLFAILACVCGLTFSVNAQKRKSSVKRAKSTATAKTASASDIKAGAEKVSTQLKNVSKFIYVLGGIARVVEDIDRDVAAGKASRGTADINAKNKQTVLATMGNVRAGLAALEVEFRTKPALRNYLLQIQGITDMSGVAEDQASGGQLTEAGKTLLLVVEKLADTLAVLP